MVQRTRREGTPGRGRGRSCLPRRALLATALATFVAATGAGTPALGQGPSQPIGPWDGTNPFNCVNQDVGTGTNFPDPDADPFCVEFDKTSQNVTDFGIVDFLSQEPFRVAAATDKCFYYQRDHWTGSIVQGSDPELWHWDGSYFFDRAKGVGGANVTNFRIGGQPADATPYVPAAYQPYFQPTGGGGVIVLMESDPDPTCMAKTDTAAERDQVYAGRPKDAHCIEPGGTIRGRRVGRARLGLSPRRLTKLLGPPRKHHRSVSRWCVVGGSTLRVAFAGRGAKRGVVLVRTDNPGQHVGKVGPGTRARRAIRRLDLERVMHVHGTRVWSARARRRAQLLVGIRRGRVNWMALADPGRLHSRDKLRSVLARMG